MGSLSLYIRKVGISNPPCPAILSDINAQAYTDANMQSVFDADFQIMTSPPLVKVMPPRRRLLSRYKIIL